jgi:uncharacterized protein YjbJ (UPF0337 family)
MPVTHDSEDGRTGTAVKGQVKEVLGAVTGDRRVEAEGKVEQQVADPEAPETEESDEAVHHAERAVRQTHDELPGDSVEAEAEGPLGT